MYSNDIGDLLEDYATTSSKIKAHIKEDFYGVLEDGRKVSEFTLVNKGKMSVSIINFGAVITQLHVKDRYGSVSDVVLGHKSLKEYETNDGYFGATIGRNSNRIAKASFYLDGAQVILEKNDDENNLHGGSRGLCFRLFDAEKIEHEDAVSLLLKHRIEDGSDGFPGNLDVKVTYTLTNDDYLVIDYNACGDRKTVVNLTNHSYFNLGGHDSGTVYNHILTLNANFYTPTKSNLIPTGEIRMVKGTPFDFRTPKEIKKDINSSNHDVASCGGFDTNFVLSGTGFREAANLYHPESGRIMQVFTDQPGVQLYTGNMISNDLVGKNSARYGMHQGICLETQAFPNSVNIPWFTNTILEKGEVYKSRTAYAFTTDRQDDET